MDGSERTLASDQRGAIMMMGLGAALVLIGALWFMMGIADTLVWRDRMQEAIDAAAFSSATIHARGMNFVAAINLIMLALVTIHVVIGLVADVITVAGAVCLLPPCTPAAPEVFDAARAVRKAQDGYDAFMWPTLAVMNVAQSAIAVAAPDLGSLAALEVGHEYGASTIALGPSNFPLGITKPRAENGAASDSFPASSWRLGLPVAFEPMSQMCKRPVAWSLDWVKSKLLDLPILKQVGQVPVLGNIVVKIINAVFVQVYRVVGGALAGLECPDAGNATVLPGFLAKARALAAPYVPLGAKPDARWAKAGGKQIWGFAYNGSQWMQVWAWTTGASKVDDEERKVAVARNRYGDVGTTSVTGRFVAQAEFYYDCRGPEAWKSTSCNGDWQLESNFSLYNMRWAARLRRFRMPSFSQFLFETATSTADSLGWLDKVVAMIPGGGRNPLGGLVDVSTIAKRYLYDAFSWVSDKLATKPGNEVIH